MAIAVSSWALHKTIGVAFWDAPTGPKPASVHAEGGINLLDLPTQLRTHGFDRLELCHFHLPSRESTYLEELKSALQEQGVTLQTLLIDDGDISDPSTSDRDRDWIAGWVDTAAQLGSEGARVIAGKQPWSEEALSRSAQHLRSLTTKGVRIRIENWFDLLKTPAHVFDLLDRLGGEVGLCMDYGNWGGPTKYEDLAAIAPRAETCHAKCEFVDPSTIDAEDYGRCLALSQSAGFNGPYVLVAGGIGDSEWDGLRLQVEFLSGNRVATKA